MFGPIGIWTGPKVGSLAGLNLSGLPKTIWNKLEYQ